MMNNLEPNGDRRILSANRTKKRIYRYDFGCEIHSQQKIYLPEREMYICGFTKWDVTSVRKRNIKVEYFI